MSTILDLLLPEAGAFYVMDRTYVDFERLYTLAQSDAFFVTRAKSNLDARHLGERAQEPNLDRYLDLYAYRYHQETAQSRGLVTYASTDPVSNRF